MPPGIPAVAVALRRRIKANRRASPRTPENGNGLFPNHAADGFIRRVPSFFQGEKICPQLKKPAGSLSRKAPAAETKWKAQGAEAAIKVKRKARSRA